MVEVEEFRDADAVASLASEWDRLRASPTPPTPFQDPEYLALWFRSLGRDAEPLALGLRERGDLLGFAPLMIARETYGPLSVSTLRFIGNNVGRPGDILFSEVLALEPMRPTVETLLGYAKRLRRASKWDLGYMPLESATNEGAQRILRLGAGDLAANPYQTYMSLDLPSDEETYLTGLSRNTRQQYRRHLRRLGDQGEVRTSVETGPDGVEKRLREAMANHDSWQGESLRADWFGGEAARRFTIDGARLLAKRGRYLAWTLDLDKIPIAWNFGAFDGRRYFEHLLSHNPEYRTHSPGATLTLSLIQELIVRGASRVESGPGDHQRKRSAGGVARTHIRFVWYRGWLRSAARLRSALRGRPRSA